MPTLNVKKVELLKLIGRDLSDKEFDDICWEFGIELDEVTTEAEIIGKEQGEDKAKELKASNDVIYKIEVPANRYDLVCLEGLALALRTFLGISESPKYSVRPSGQKVIIRKATSKSRPFIACAILRNVTFTEESLLRIIDFQDKLHGTICKNRSLASIGTYDYDTIKGDIFYDAPHPSEIKFKRLKGTEVETALQIMDTLSKDQKLKKFCHLMDGLEGYPLLIDSVGQVLSMPPMINSEETRLHKDTRNVFIDVTGLDDTKTKLVLTTIICAFSIYCAEPFSIESVTFVSELDNSTWEYPTLTPIVLKTNVNYLNNLAGIDIPVDEVENLLRKFGMGVNILSSVDLEITVPVARTDVLHPCDIAEDLAIAYGYNKIKKIKPQTVCSGFQQPINKLTDLMRQEMAQYGYVECLTFALISKKDHFISMENPNFNFEDVVSVFGAKTSEFEVFRSSLIPGILKTIESNMTSQVPFKMFELSDVVVTDKRTETGAKNQRRLCFAYVATNSGFEVVHGTIDNIMNSLQISYNPGGTMGYYIVPSNVPFLFPDRQAYLIINGKDVGIFGIVHPKVLKNFNIKYPVVIAELDIEYIFNLVISGVVMKIETK